VRVNSPLVREGSKVAPRLAVDFARSLAPVKADGEGEGFIPIWLRVARKAKAE
jgi:hypothetical protein